MPSGTRQYTTPVLVEVKPGNLGIKSRSNMAPSSPSPSPKAVRFDTDGLVKSKARPLTPTEAWSFYHFEMHARSCRICYNPLEVFARGSRFCSAGQSLAHDVFEHVYYKDGEVYSTSKDNHKHVRLELAAGYDQLRQLLRTRERPTTPKLSTARTVPVVTYEPVAPAVRRPTREERNEVIVEPQSTESRTHRRAKHRSTRYRPVAVEDDYETTIRTPEGRDERRGSLYMQRPREKVYRVEIREPTDVRERRRDHRRSGYWD